MGAPAAEVVLLGLTGCWGTALEAGAGAPGGMGRSPACDGTAPYVTAMGMGAAPGGMP